MAKKFYTGSPSTPDWNKGYSDGYHKREPTGTSDAYWFGFNVGSGDRIEDEEAVKSGTFDLLTKEEREYLYGDESDRI